MNMKRKNNNFKTVKNDKKNNTYAIVLCVLIFFWTIASFLGTIAFFRSFDDDDTLLVNADTAVAIADDVPVPVFDPSRDGDFIVPLLPSDVPIYFALYLEFVDNIPTYVHWVNWEDRIIYDLETLGGFITADNFYFEMPLYEDGLDYWSYFFENPIFLTRVNNLRGDSSSSYEIVGFEYFYGSISDIDYLFNIRFCYDEYHKFYQGNVTNFMSSSFRDSQKNYNDYVTAYQAGYNAGYTGTQADINNARQEGYNQGYADGLNKNKYGPFSNMMIGIGFNNLFDEAGDSLATGWQTEYSSAEIPNALYSIGFNAGRFYYDYVLPTILAEFEDYDYFDDTTLVFDFTGDVFSANTYPFRFYLPSLASDATLDVRYTDRSEVSYQLKENTDEGGNTYYTIPFDVSKSIDWFSITLRGGEDILTAVSIAVYGQAYQEGYNAGSSVGYNNGYTAGKDIGYEQGYNGGFQVGKLQGFNEGVASANEYSFLGLLTSVVDAPLKVFYDMFDFEILGYNMSSFFIALLSICIVIAVVKVILAR